MRDLRLIVASALALAVSFSALPQGVPAAREEKPNTYDGKASPPIGVTPAPRKAAGCIRLAAFNVENLFDNKDDPGLSGEYDDIKMTTDVTRLKNLAAAIRELDADVLALEEVESEECLRWFRDNYLKDLGYEHLGSRDVGYYRGVEQSVLSRFPILGIQTYPEMKIAAAAERMPKDPAERKRQKWAEPDSMDGNGGFQRSPLHARIKLPDGSTLDLLVVHFKAGGKKFAHQRELEALSTVNLVDAVRAKDKDAQIAVVGDFNAMPMDMTAKALREKSLGGLISAYELRPGARKGDGDEGDGGSAKSDRRKYLTHSFVPEDKPGKPIERTIDYILLSPNLFQKGQKGSYFVLSVPKSLQPGSAKPAGYASDHCPLAVDLKIAAKEDAKPAPKGR
jgi:endonuclease/exonuclease/phosphatase family metal-dependent hydrolase